MSQIIDQLARGRMRKVVWELLARPSLEHTASVWWTGGKIVSKKLEADQDRVSKKVLGASGRCRCARRPRMEEARGPKKGEEKMLYGRRVKRLDDSRLVEVIARKREECRRISWWGEYDQLYGLDDNERGSAQRRT